MAHYDKSPNVSHVGRGDNLDDYQDAHELQQVFKTGEADRMDMVRMNKPQQMRRNFRFTTMFGFSVILMASWEVILATAPLGLLNGGTAGLLYTNLATWLGFIAVYASLGEQGSMAPTSGGQYHWVSEFSPRSIQKFTSYIVGWLGVLGWQVGVAYASYLAATQIQGLAVLNYPDYVKERWHGTLIQIALLVLSVLFNTFLAQRLHLIEGCALVLHVCGFFGILIPLWVLSPTEKSEVVWTTFNSNGWQSTGLACMIGTVASVAPLLGADAAAHMAEELQDAAYTLPRILTWATAINGGLMFVMCITICYVIGDAAVTDVTGYPFITMFYNTTGSYAAANAMTAIIIILSFFTCITITAGSSRQLFAFARDQGVPFSNWIAAVRPGYDVPVNAVLVIFAISVVLSLINIGSTLAFSIITSLGTGTLTLSYIITISVVVWRKITGQPLLPSRFNMGKTFGLIVNLIALGWMMIVLIFCFFPLFPPPILDASLMNYAIVVWGAVLIFAAVYFLVYARKAYAGPVAYVRKLD